MKLHVQFTARCSGNRDRRNTAAPYGVHGSHPEKQTCQPDAQPLSSITDKLLIDVEVEHGSLPENYSYHAITIFAGGGGTIFQKLIEQ